MSDLAPSLLPGWTRNPTVVRVYTDEAPVRLTTVGSTEETRDDHSPNLDHEEVLLRQGRVLGELGELHGFAFA